MMKIENTDIQEDKIIERNPRSKKDKIIPEEEVEKDIQKDDDEAPYQDDYMPDSPQHGVISSRPDLFEEDEEPLVGDGTVSESTVDYDEENIEEYSTPD